MKTKPKKSLGQMLHEAADECRPKGNMAFVKWEAVREISKKSYERTAKKFLLEVNAK